MNDIIFPLCVVVVLLLILGGAYLGRRQQEDVRQEAAKEAVVCTVPIVARKQLPNGSWSKTYNAMKLVVRESTIEITTVLPALGVLLGCDWHLRASELSMEVSGSLPGIHQREWVLLCGVETTVPMLIAVSAAEQTNEIWAALINAGVQPIAALAD
jgi:hypothetical protein